MQRTRLKIFLAALLFLFAAHQADAVTKVWRGDSTAVAQVTSWTFGGTFEADDIVTVTLNGKTLTVTAGSTTTTTVVDNVVTAYNASTVPEFSEMTASRSGSDLRLTADTAGRAFTDPTLATTESGGGAADAQTIGAATATTASAGPSHWNTAANWEPSGVPVAADDVFIERGSDILYGLDQSAVTLTSLNIVATYTGKIGLPAYEGDYVEHRDQFLKVGATTINIGSGPGNSSGRIKLNTGSVQTTLNVFNSGQPAETGIESVLFKGTHASNAVNIVKGQLGIAVFAGETATVTTMRVGYVSNVAADSKVRCGTGVTLTTINQSGGELTIQSNVTTVNMTDGTLDAKGSMTATTLNIDGGQLYYQSTGTVTNLNISDGGKVSFARNMQSRTVTSCDLYSGAELLDPFSTVTFSNGLDLNRAALSEMRIDLGVNRRLVPSAAP